MTEQRAWQVALKRVRALEASWDAPAARQREILACQTWFRAQEHLPHLHKLAALLDPGMDRLQLASVLAPVERAAGRRRVTDAEILDADAPLADAPPDRMDLTVVVDCLRSAFNLGGVFRTAECLGASAVWLCGYTADPTHPQVAHAAMGTERLTPYRQFERLSDALAELRRNGVRSVALETVAGACAPEAFAWVFPCAVVLGNERFGLGPETLAAVDGVVRIPSFGRKNSLNVVTAFAICAYQARVIWNTRPSARLTWPRGPAIEG